MSDPPFRPGIETLLRRARGLIAGRPTALVTHMAAVDSQGISSVDRLARCPHVDLRALFAPEHGLFSAAPAGQAVRTRRHPVHDLPVFSLYGTHRKPTARMLRGIEAVVVDLQDLGARAYTYLSTLRLVMEACAERGIGLVVADRPVPLPDSVDGPLLDPAFESFVAAVPMPMSTGMTPGEAAVYLKAELGLDLDLRVAAMSGYERRPGREPDWPPWIPPSPGIRSWEAARCYLATVFCEGLPFLDHGRGTGLAFQVLGTPLARGKALLDCLGARPAAGVRLVRQPYVAGAGDSAGRLLDGLRLIVTDPARFRPVALSIRIVEALQTVIGTDRLWSRRSARPAFFDALYGTDRVRGMLQDGMPAAAIIRQWRAECRSYRRRRTATLLYAPRPPVAP